jgi:cyclophilin family peptidyl-prolyl cis-trans isomerase
MRTCFLLLLLAIVFPANAATLATFRTSVGDMQVEFFDEDKPVTVSNFIQYVTSGRFENQIIHRWEPGFVIQGGGYRVETNTNPFQLRSVERFNAIPNEYHSGRTNSNTYGTIAMARAPGQVNSATSEWFFNLGDNSFLDDVDDGFTVFGRIRSGTNVLNLFLAPPGSNGIYTNRTILPGNMPLPLLNSTNATFTNLIYVHVLLERDLGLEIRRGVRGDRTIGWNTLAGVTNTVEFSTDLNAGTWQIYTNVLGTGARLQVPAVTADRMRFYRVRLPR